MDNFLQGLWMVISFSFILSIIVAGLKHENKKK